MPIQATEPCDLAVWDTHGDPTREVRRELRNVVRHQAARLMTAAGRWHDARVVIGWPRRVTASFVPGIGEAVLGLQKVHRPRIVVVVGPAAVGGSGQEPGQAVWIREAAGVATRWSDEATAAADQLGIDLQMLAAITNKGQAAPPATRPTAARVAGRWLGRALGGPPQSAWHDTSASVAAKLAELLPEARSV